MKFQTNARTPRGNPITHRLPSSPFACLLFASALGVMASSARAQTQFSIDYRGPTNGAPSPCPGMPIGPGDILTPTTGAPCAPSFPAYGPLPPPSITIAFPVFGLLPPIACPPFPGGLCPVELDALSFGADYPVPMGPLPAGTYVFSVDEFAVGRPGSPLFPNVLSEAPVLDHAADVFEALGLPGSPLPIPLPAAAVPGNSGITDGNGLISPSGAHYPGVGVLEPRPAFPGPGPRPGDNIDALDMDTPAIAIGAFYSLDGMILDPATGTPGLGSAMVHGFLPGDVIATYAPGGPAVMYAPAFLLGLDLFGPPGSDDLDALALAENGVFGYQVGFGPYAWLAGADMLLFSVRRGSAVIGMFDSLLGIPICPGDILCPPVAPGLPPAIFIPAEYLGLATMRMVPFGGDDLDALDTRAMPATGLSFCHGDGDVIACPCGNTGAAGYGCANSAFPTGALLGATGIAKVSADTVLLTASSMTGATCVFFQGTAPAGPFVVDDGIGCVGGAVIRLGTKAIAAGTSSFPTGADPLISVKGLLPLAGGTRLYQCFYRNAVLAFCPPATSNRTNGVQIVWTP